MTPTTCKDCGTHSADRPLIPVTTDHGLDYRCAHCWTPAEPTLPVIKGADVNSPTTPSLAASSPMLSGDRTLRRQSPRRYWQYHQTRLLT